MALDKNLKKQYVLKPLDLKKKLDSSNFRIIDCRWYLGQPNRGEIEYRAKHIKGAIHFDIDKISDQLSKLPHMFPKKEHFEIFIRKNGINQSDKIILYDETGFFSTTRVWLIFHYFGFENTQILDGGFNAWQNGKFPITSKIKKIKESNYICKNIPDDILIKKKEVENILKLQNTNIKIVDARPKDRFNGIISEPREGLRRGNIKGSINIPFDSILKSNGFIKNLTELRKLILYDNKIKMKNEVISYCGSGITACNIILALKMLGFKKVKLYDGSWAEWGKK